MALWSVFQSLGMKCMTERRSRSERTREGVRVTGNDSGYMRWPLERSQKHDGEAQGDREKREFGGGRVFGDKVWDRMPGISALLVVKVNKKCVLHQCWTEKTFALLQHPVRQHFYTVPNVRWLRQPFPDSFVLGYIAPQYNQLLTDLSRLNLSNKFFTERKFARVFTELIDTAI